MGACFPASDFGRLCRPQPALPLKPDRLPWSMKTRVGFFKHICDLLAGANIAARRNIGASARAAASRNRSCEDTFWTMVNAPRQLE